MAGGRFDIDAYLRRIGAGGPLKPGAPETLSALHEAHCAAVPFENLDILLGKPISLELDALQAKIVGGRRGGYCFEQNTLFRAALESLGYGVSSLAARALGGVVIRPRTHMLLLVDQPGGHLVADVGFGGHGPARPVPLAEGVETRTGFVGHRLRREGPLWVLQADLAGAWEDLYAFTLEPQHPVDFVMANHFTSTHPRSPLVLNLTAQRTRPERRAILRNRQLVVHEGATPSTLAIRDPEHLLHVLAEDFGLWFPVGTRFSRPEF